MNIKGTAVISLPKYVERFHKMRYQEWIDSLSPASKSIHMTPIMAGQMYPLYEALIHPTEQICNLFFNGNEKGAWELGKFSADYALHGFYKIFLRLGSPSFIIKRSPNVFASYYEDSALLVSDSGSNHCVLQITQFPEPYWLLDLRIAGWMEKAIMLSGGKNPKVEITKSLSKGDSRTEFQSSWD